MGEPRRIRLLGSRISTHQKRHELAAFLRRARTGSFGGYGWRLNAGLPEYDRELHYPVKDLVREFFRSGRPVEVLDGGCGTAQAAAELKQHFGDRVNVSGIGLVRLPSREELEKNRHKWRFSSGRLVFGEDKDYLQARSLVEQFHANRKLLANYWAGLMETHAFGGKRFDVIISTLALKHSRYVLYSVENLLNHQSPGGAALLNLEKIAHGSRPALTRTVRGMRRAGCKVSDLGGHRVLVRRPITLTSPIALLESP